MCDYREKMALVLYTCTKQQEGHSEAPMAFGQLQYLPTLPTKFQRLKLPWWTAVVAVNSSGRKCKHDGDFKKNGGTEDDVSLVILCAVRRRSRRNYRAIARPAGWLTRDCSHHVLVIRSISWLSSTHILSRHWINSKAFHKNTVARHKLGLATWLT